ncbi:1-deoxy-D-xylulose-5-phosphate reductoisomerase [Fusobacterium sp. FSA-380-WT-3A]|uniref:1-deoxy-D-xylulose-5-phosphate reductoisomerase n=1 Tax=Fusobacterium sp. FSA-380-WT-3A TaxID=2725304 RepID=UPI001476DC0F|nr:1-deoxy-D-xylulose-5-phosphate reductoisomerase [Fusobacterium sp. FSA-380-WT-3A]NME35674.1 1-deoxy-D-xylulose-5-phosphate reductoisomerase [Fusobacterium sp. FSA-380-WT-3A]
MKNITILGSTGSIGTNALEIIKHKRDEFNVIALSGHSNYKLIIEQIREFNPKYVSIGTEEGKEKIKAEFPEVEVYVGREGLKKLGQLEETDIILVSVIGAIGIEATSEAIKLGKRIALANKETMVAGGDYINKLLRENPKSEIIPVDSEHSAIFQSLLAGKKSQVKNIILTASGGTFRGKKKVELRDVTVEEALKHPNWSMGKKITVDSSSLVNKGLEVIEAHHLFNVDYDKIKVVIHPQSIIHSLVEFQDNAVIAQLGVTDMKLPIQLAFTYPDRIENSCLEALDLLKVGNLTFEEPDRKVFKGLDLAYKAGKIGKSMPTVLNAANEVSVDLFLKKKIKFLDIYKIIEKAMDNHSLVEIDDLDSILKVDRETREWIYKNYKEII